MLESRFPDESRDSLPCADSSESGIAGHAAPDREDERASASLFSQPWQSGVKVVSDLGLSIIYNI